MVNVKKLLEQLDGLAYECDHDIKLCENVVTILWQEHDLNDATTIPQLMGRLNESLPVDKYDEIYTRLDDTVFEPNLAKVKENLEKLGLKGRFDEVGDYELEVGTYIYRKCFYCVENMQPIPDSNNSWRGEELYNNVLKASKEWK